MTEDVTLPNLPGYRILHRPNIRSGSKSSNFTFVEGERFIKEYPLPRIDGGLDNGLKGAVGALLPHARTQSIAKHEHIILYFQAYLKEVVENGSIGDKHRVRKCSVYYYTEDDTQHIIEKPQLQCGIPQRTLLERQLVHNLDGTVVELTNFVLGEDVNILGNIYQICDCDAATRKYLSVAQASAAGEDLNVSQHQQTDKNEWSKYHSKITDTKKFLEATLGKNVDNKDMKGFFQYGGQTLKLLCLWDNTDCEHRDAQLFSFVYHLCDDTVEIFSKPPKTSSEPVTRFLARCRLPKSVPALGFGTIPELEYYSWKDLAVGKEIFVYGRNFRIIDYDSFTQEFFEENGRPLGAPEPAFKPQASSSSDYESEIPAPAIFESEEDSLRLPVTKPIEEGGVCYLGWDRVI